MIHRNGGIFIDKQTRLIEINNKCTSVQNNIAKYYDSPENQELLDELSRLSKLLNAYSRGHLQK